MNTYAPHFRAQSVTAPPDRGEYKAALRLRLVVYLCCADLIALGAAFVAVHAIGSADFAAGEARFLTGAILPAHLMSAFLFRTYAAANVLRWRASVARLLAALLTGSAFLLLLLTTLATKLTVTPGSLAASLALAAGLMTLLRAGHVAYASRRLGGRLESVIELHDGPSPGAAAGTAIDIRAFFDPQRPNPFSLDHLARMIGRADRVVLYCSGERRAAWAQVLQSMNVHAEIVVHEWNDVRPIGIGSHLGATTMVVASGPLSFHQRIVKRGFDVAFSALVLVALAPLLALVAVAIKLDSRGPVFFRQPRIGRQNKLFNVIKFRSMAAERCDALGEQSTGRADPRTTRVGRFIRRTSIDELPQFINVLKGDMSVVGPRPHAISSTAEALLFWEVDERYWRRHAGRPGLTGRAQIQGLRGATASMRDLTDRVEADLLYLQSWSFWNDLAIIAKTFRALLNPNAF